MANYKRKKSRLHAGIGHNNDLKRKYGDDWYWWQGTPSSHNLLFHTRPRRMKERHMVQKVLRGEDPDNMNWPLAKKPHMYYW